MCLHVFFLQRSISSNRSEGSGSTTESYDFVLPSRSWGRGRGRGASRQLEPRPGPSNESGGGRSRGKQGKTKAKMAFTLSANNVTRLQLTHQQKKEQCDALVDRLTGEEARDVLKEISKKMPFLVLDVADKLQAGPQSTLPRGDFSDWCICHELCHSINAEMRLMILDAGVLRTQMLYRNDVFARHAASEKDVNKSYRHAGYRQYILIHHGWLGLGVRRPVPSCCTWAIQDTFPDPDGFYVPYEPSW
ncbi:hypothetical protein DPMN_130720 [Dreissena polymorpha]|uniref:P2X purinoreceptor 7 intracellular domain-containing protein n=1 Tax=Dreissena polymorpha TaxID=45954 RepID=A0A9D4K1Y8_DREPO|nr:hypothetical protein DPMN_130720 [Dreissena polymorpha]